LFTIDWDIKFGTMSPNAVLSTVITASAHIAPANTIARGCRIAMIAAMMNVSSPSSLTRIMEMEAAKASLKPPPEALSSSARALSVYRCPFVCESASVNVV
jgi:hypothetical protein